MVQPQIHIGQRLPEGIKPRHQPTRGKHRACTQGDHMAPIGAGEALHSLGDGAEGRGHGIGEFSASGSEFHLAHFAFKQGCAQCPFQSLDLMTDRGGCEA